MMEYSDNNVERFIMDDNFQNWVKHPTAESASFWEKWIAEHPEDAEEIQKARLIILSMDFKKTAEKEIPRHLLLERIQAAIHEGQRNIIPIKSNFANIYYKVAAVFLGLIICTAALYLLTHGSSEGYSTAYGEIKNLILPDGSTIVLNANSSVHFENNWEDHKAREVWLKGEAFFKIIHQEDHQKFVVHTGQLDVEVLGTEFNVATRRNKTKVVLASGKVKLNTKGITDDELYMDPGESVELSGDDNKIIKRRVNPDQFSSWRRKQLVFKATPLAEIAQTLEDNYGWESTFKEDTIKTYQFTGTVSTESVEEIELLLVAISEAFNIEVLKEDNEIIFKKKK